MWETLGLVFGCLGTGLFIGALSGYYAACKDLQPKTKEVKNAHDN